MYKIAIVYASVHHDNTKRVAELLARRLNARVYNALDAEPDASEYDILIIASGIYLGSIHKKLTRYIERAPLNGKRVILVYTCGINCRDYMRSARSQLTSRGADILGSCGCRGYDTYGIFGWIGGIAKGHPNTADVERIAARVCEMIEKTGTE